jgi:two-component system NtrC family response regulator
VHARTGDHRSAAFDAVLRARLDLVIGQPHAALAHCRAALADLERRGARSRRRGAPHSGGARARLAGSARGSGGRARQPDPARPRRAKCAKCANAPSALTALEREERPAVLALAGQSEAALAEAADSPFFGLWRAALTGHAAPEAAWMELRSLDRYRQARLVLDLELTTPGLTPLYWLRRAAATLQRVGAEPLAARLEPRKRGGWEAVEGYLRAPADPAELPRLFFTAGYPEARLSWSRGGAAGRAVSERTPAGRAVSERTGPRWARAGGACLVDGSGGGEELSASAAGGLLTLRAPLLDPTLRALFALALRDLDAGGARPASGDAVRGGLLGDSPLLLAAVERVALLAPGELPLLILGETGTGKELLAKQAHTLSRRAAGPFVPMNCAAVSEHLLLSELFGHVRGAFTGADRDRVGVFETAKGGTVFLDEIGDLPPNAQGMLLRALQEGEIRRVGETLPRRIDVRVVAATHRDLAAMVKAAAFRQDLYYRLRGATVTLPPLRERGEDVVTLAEHFLARAARPARLSARARAVVLGHPWPGNVRELKNCMEVAAMLSGGRAVQPEHIDLPSAPARAGASYHQRLDALRRDLLVEALQLSGGRRAEAARRLGLTRQAMAYLVKQLDL